MPSPADCPDVSAIVTWLVDGAPGAKGPAEVVGQLAERLVVAGVPIERVAAFVRTLHPSIMGRRFQWTTGQPVSVTEAPYATLESPAFRASALGHVFRTGEFARRRATDRLDPPDPSMQDLFGQGYTDLFLCPLAFLSGEVHAISFGTRRPSGFTEGQVAALRAITPALSRIAEILALWRTAANLLSTYVGHNAGGRILSGKIHRGDVETIRAVIWFSDLRGFTSLAGELSPPELIGALNDLFECQVPHIEQAGGEVLKFMGDGLFAIFPVEPDGANAAAQCEAALVSAERAFAALEHVSATRTARGAPALRFGLALHLGDVAYGNIGGAGRLDFTCIGPAVNLAARLEGLASKLGRRLVVSEAFRDGAGRPMEPLGEFELKGVAAPARVFAPAG